MLLPILVRPFIAFRTFITFRASTVLIFLTINLEHSIATNAAVKLHKEYKTGQKVTNQKTSLLNVVNKITRRLVSLMCSFFFCRMLLEENLECTFHNDLFISVVYFRVSLLTLSVFFL